MIMIIVMITMRMLIIGIVYILLRLILMNS